MRAKTKELEIQRRLKISRSLKGRKPSNVIAGWNKGKPAPWAAANLKGVTPWNKGKKGVQVSSRKGIARPENSGDKHPNWKGGFDKKSYQKKYRKENLDRIYFLNLKRRSMRLQANGSHTLKEWQELKKEYNYRCACCKAVKPLTQDHITPLSKGGSDNIDNIQPLCKNCNSSKHTSIIKYKK